jgi:hypothetical protein
MEFSCDDARGHGRNHDLFSGGNCIHLCISKFDLPCINIVDQLVAVHKSEANDVVVQLVDNIYRMCEFSSFYPEVHLIDPNRVHCIPEAATQLCELESFLG